MSDMRSGPRSARQRSVEQRSVQRSERLADLIRAEIAEIIARDLKDPRIGFTTVTAVRLSKDRQHAKVFFSVLGSDEQQKETLRGLNSAVGFIRGEVCQRLRLRLLPEIRFVLDRTGETSARIDRLFEQIKSDTP